MRRLPRDSRDGIFSGGVGVDVAYQGILVSLLTLAAFFIGHYMEFGEWTITNSPDGVSMAFLTMSMAEIFHSFNMRSLHGSVFAIKSQNKWLWGAGALSLILTTAVIEIPFLAKAFIYQSVNVVNVLFNLLCLHNTFLLVQR